MRSDIFCDITQGITVVFYRIFWTTYRSHLQGSSSLFPHYLHCHPYALHRAFRQRLAVSSSRLPIWWRHRKGHRFIFRDWISRLPYLHRHLYALQRVFRLRSEVPSTSLPIWWRHNVSWNFSTEIQFYPSWHVKKSAELNTASLAWYHAKPSCFTTGGQPTHQQPPTPPPPPQKKIFCFILEPSDVHERLMYICSPEHWYI